MMTDRLALLREEIQAEIAMRQRTIDAEAMQIDVLERVLIRMNRIESEHPADAAPTPAADTGRARRRDLRAEIAQISDAGDLPLALPLIADRLSITQSAAKRALDALVRHGLLDYDVDAKVYRRPRTDLAEAAQ